MTTAVLSKNADLLKKAFEYMATAKGLTDLYEDNFKLVSKYVHATSRGHEAIQIAVGMQLLPQDYLFAYYRDDAMLLALGMQPFELMLQLMAKRDDPFSGGRSYYCHPSLNDPDKPKIPHNSSATGMQAIPATGVAMGMKYKELEGLNDGNVLPPICVCSLGDASVTEGEVAEAFQMAALKQLPILYLVQDNEWDISAYKSEIRTSDAHIYAAGFPGIEAISIDGTDFMKCQKTIQTIIQTIRDERRPFLLHVTVPLLNHHTSGVRKEWYRDDLVKQMKRDPYPKLIKELLKSGVTQIEIDQIENDARQRVEEDFIKAKHSPDPTPEDLYTHAFAETPVTSETGIRAPAGAEDTVMVDSALSAVQELMEDHPECVLYGQDVGPRLGGVFREAATLAQKFGNNRVFNTPIQEAYIIGSTVGMSAVGLKPIVEVQFADYIWPGLNQLFTEVSRSCYLSNGKWPVGCIIRVPIGAYGSGGPYHSSSVETVVTNIRGVKIAYPSTGADLKGLIKSAFYDPNPVVIFEHKGLYWSKVKGTDAAKTPLPDREYMIPFGVANIVQHAHDEMIQKGRTLLIVTYGMGVHWSLNASLKFDGKIEILDLRTLVPLDTNTIYERSKVHGKVIVLTEESVDNSFAQSIAARIQEQCFEYLDGPVVTIGSKNLPAIPLNSVLEQEMIPSSEKLEMAIAKLLNY